MSTKQCFKCGVTKAVDAFYKHSRMKDGHLNKCISCTKNDVSNHRLENIERIRSYDRMRSSMPSRKQKLKQNFEKWRDAHPLERKAQIIVGNAIQRQKLKKQPCFVCGETKVDAHHPDYSRPLDVIWLCRPHHIKLHAEHMKYKNG